MTYSPFSPGDEKAHGLHHKGVVEGIEWVGKEVELGAKGVRVVEERVVVCRGPNQIKRESVGRIVCVEGEIVGVGRVGKKVRPDVSFVFWLFCGCKDRLHGLSLTP